MANFSLSGNSPVRSDWLISCVRGGAHNLILCSSLINIADTSSSPALGLDLKFLMIFSIASWVTGLKVKFTVSSTFGKYVSKDGFPSVSIDSANLGPIFTKKLLNPSAMSLGSFSSFPSSTNVGG